MKLGLGGAIVAGVVGIAALQTLFSSPAPPVPAKSPEQIAADNKKEAVFQKVVGVLKVVQAANRNPDSVKWESIRASADASLICIEYRGQNGFGGMNKEIVIVVNTTAYHDAATWNRHCTAPLQDMKYAARAI